MDCGCLVPQVDEDASWYGTITQGVLVKVSLEPYTDSNIKGTMNERVAVSRAAVSDLNCSTPLSVWPPRRTVYVVYVKECLAAVCSSDQYARELFPGSYVTKLKLDSD